MTGCYVNVLARQVQLKYHHKTVISCFVDVTCRLIASSYEVPYLIACWGDDSLLSSSFTLIMLDGRRISKELQRYPVNCTIYGGEKAALSTTILIVGEGFDLQLNT